MSMYNQVDPLLSSFEANKPVYIQQNLEDENRKLRRQLKYMKDATKRLEEKYARLNDEINDMLIDVSRTATQRNMYKNQMIREQSKNTELEIDKIKLEMDNEALKHKFKMLERLNKEVSSVLVDVARLSAQRNAYVKELQRVQRKKTELLCEKFVKEVEIEYLRNYLKVVQESRGYVSFLERHDEEQNNMQHVDHEFTPLFSDHETVDTGI